MRSPYEEFRSVANNVNATDNGMPYHARENSQPFSYGQISNNKTSTLLRNTRTNNGDQYRSTTSWDELDSGSTINKRVYNTNSVSQNYNYTNNYNNSARSPVQQGSESNTSMIKAQPRLTSPLLVRKTINSRSPTRNSANTIANTYHYSYNTSSSPSSAVRSGSGGGGGGWGQNGDINKYNTNTINTSNSNSSNSYYTNNSALRKTPTRNDFEELLRERREKVYNEYKATATSASAHVPNGQSNQNKYNFDFEFNLNLDEIPVPPRRSNTMERSSLQYRTHNIPMASEIERNYHTISSTQARDLKEKFARQEYERRPPVDTHYNRRIQQESSTLYDDDRYGNENKSSYNYLYSQNRESAGLRENTSPIYATSTKQKQQYQQQQEEQPQQQQQYQRQQQYQQQQQQYQHQQQQYQQQQQQQQQQQYKQQQPINSSNSYYRSISTTHDIHRAVEPELSITDYASAALSSPTVNLASRPETPAFPVTPRTPYGAHNGYNANFTQPRSSSQLRIDNSGSQMSPEMHNYSAETIYTTNTTHRSRLNSSLSLNTSTEPQEVAPHLVKFAKDSSQYWYKPNLSRDEAISLLLHAAPGTFIVRDSTTYKNAYGLVLRVAQPPPGSATGKPDELVRHFLIEPTTRGVRLKGCANEPVFTSLSALVYEHSINALALPCVLLIPEQDLVPNLVQHTPAQKQLLTQGAACNVLWLFSCDTESLTGEEAIRKAIRLLYAQQPLPTPTEVHFKVSQQGITLTDNTRKKFFRKHYVADMISYCAIDPDHRLWTMSDEGQVGGGGMKKTIFAFVARRSPSSKDNQCHVFCDLAINQPASAIVSFANKTLPTEKQKNYVL